MELVVSVISRPAGAYRGAIGSRGERTAKPEGRSVCHPRRRRADGNACLLGRYPTLARGACPACVTTVLQGGCATPGPGAISRCGPTAASTLIAWYARLPTTRWNVRFSITLRQHKSLHNVDRGQTWNVCLECRFPTGWTALADVAETTYIPFQSEPDAAPVLLIVRLGLKPTPGSLSWPALRQTAITASSRDRDGEMLTGVQIIAVTHEIAECDTRPQVRCQTQPHLLSGRFAA